MKRLFLAFAFLLTPGFALAQGCGLANPNCIVPTAPPLTSNNQAASTAYADRASGTSTAVLYANNFSGATNGDKISACVAALPFQGGTCDARGLPALGTIPTITIAKSGVTILGPCGVQDVTGTINIYTAGSQTTDTNWYGCGASFNFDIGTQFFWTGNNTDPMFRLRGVRDSYYANFAIKADLTNPLAEGIRLESSTGAVATNRIFNNIIIYSVRATGLIKGMRWCTGNDCGGTGLDANNDLDTLYNVVVSNYDNCAFSIEGTQSKTHSFFNSSFAGQAQSQRGVCTTQGMTNSGSFRWFGGGGGRNSVADFDLGAVADYILIQGLNTESSARLLQTASASSAPWSITIQGVRWTSDGINPDGKAIIYKERGVLNIEGLEIETGGSTVPPTISIESSGTPQLGYAVGNVIQSFGATQATNPFICNTASCWDLRGNLVVNPGSGNNFIIPNSTPTQVISTAGLPTIASGACGTGTNGAVVAGSTNQSGNITIGASATTTCVLTWSQTLAVAPHACAFFPANAAAAATGTTVASVGAPTTASVTLSGSALANANYSYICL